MKRRTVRRTALAGRHSRIVGQKRAGSNKQGEHGHKLLVQAETFLHLYLSNMSVTLKYDGLSLLSK